MFFENKGIFEDDPSGPCWHFWIFCQVTDEFVPQVLCLTQFDRTQSVQYQQQKIWEAFASF